MDEDVNEVARYRRQQKDEKRDRTLRDMALRNLLADPGGRSYLWWLLQIGKWGINPFAAERARTDFNCGEYNVGLQILNHILEVDPTGFIRMQQEQADATRARAEPDPTDSAEPTDEPAGPSQPAAG